MPLADDPRAFILRMFELEVREGRGHFCQVFPNGECTPGMPLEVGELIYGVYKEKYFFTPAAAIIKTRDACKRIAWSNITACSSRHGDGEKIAELSLVDGTKERVAISDLATGWAGRISQLFYGMIERWGNRTAFGSPLMTIEEFFGQCDDEYCFAPNLQPHPTLDEIKEALLSLRSRTDVEDLLVGVAEVEDGVPVSDYVVIVSSSPSSAFEDFAGRFGADGVIPAADATLRKLKSTGGAVNAWELRWD